jgi:hypothetical protein
MTPQETKEWIWSRCHEDGDCLLWDGGTDDQQVPYLRMPGSRKVEAARRVLLTALGVDVTGRVATTTCDNPLCLCEDHCVAWTRAKLQKRSGKKLAGNVVRAAKLQAARRPTATLDIEKVREMRASGMTTREAAAKYGVTQSTAHKAMTGKAWKDFGANPFFGLGARL